MTSYKNSDGKWVGDKALKGKLGIVVDARFDRDTASGLELQIQINSYDPNKPVKVEWVDYDGVVELRYVSPLSSELY